MLNSTMKSSGLRHTVLHSKSIHTELQRTIQIASAPLVVSSVLKNPYNLELYTQFFSFSYCLA